MLIALMSALLLAGVDAASPAPSPAPPAAAASPAPAKPKGPDLVCVEEKPTGSHFPKRICMTRDQADLAERQAKDAMSNRIEIHRKGGIGPS